MRGVRAMPPSGVQPGGAGLAPRDPCTELLLALLPAACYPLCSEDHSTQRSCSTSPLGSAPCPARTSSTPGGTESHDVPPIHPLLDVGTAGTQRARAHRCSPWHIFFPPSS